MTLALSITNVDRLDNGESTRLVIDRHGAIIGRSAHADWSLPDPRNHVSGSHCEIEYRDGGYVLIDRSTNGTFVNGSSSRLAGPHVLRDGDEISVGHYRILASLAGDKKPQAAGGEASKGWGDWDTPSAGSGAHDAWGPAASPAPAPAPARSAWDAPSPTPSPPPSPAWDAPSPVAAPSAWGPADPQPSHAGSGWASSPAPESMEPWAAPKDAPSGWAPQPAGRWGEEPVADEWSQPAAAITGRGPMAQRFAPPPVETEPVHDPVDVWSRVAATHDVDWARGGFGAGGWADPAPAQAPAAAVSTAPITAQAGAGAWQALLEGAGLSAAQIKGDPAEASRAAGVLLKQLISGLVVLLEARARAKAQLGAQGTLYQREGSNNPLKWARSPSDALVQLLSAPERGSMPADQAVQDSFKDLQAHQMATLVAMQGALRDTLDRFSPASIRQRAETRGVLAKIIPSAREAELWRAYEREFQGVVEGSDEAFMDVFAKAFREAYDKASGGGG